MKKLAGTKWFLRLVTIALLAMLVVGISPGSAEAKYWDSSHSVLCYERNDIPSDLQPYIRNLEHDARAWTGAGARLYLTLQGAWFGNTPWGARRLASLVTSDPLWKSNADRSLDSVTLEITGHTPWKTDPIHIEYRYDDLKWWEKIMWGR